MSWLKAFGQIMNKVAGAAASIAGLEPLVRVLLPASVTQNQTFQKVDNTLSKIFGAIVTAEVMVTAINGPNVKSGGDMLKAATPIVSQLLSTCELFTGKEIKDPVKHAKAVQDVTSALADLLNSY